MVPKKKAAIRGGWWCSCWANGSKSAARTTKAGSTSWGGWNRGQFYDEGYLPDELDFVDQQHFEYSDSPQVGPGYLLGQLDDTLG